MYGCGNSRDLVLRNRHDHEHKLASSNPAPAKDNKSVLSSHRAHHKSQPQYVEMTNAGLIIFAHLGISLAELPDESGLSHCGHTERPLTKGSGGSLGCVFKRDGVRCEYRERIMRIRAPRIPNKSIDWSNRPMPGRAIS